MFRWGRMPQERFKISVNTNTPPTENKSFLRHFWKPSYLQPPPFPPFIGFIGLLAPLAILLHLLPPTEICQKLTFPTYFYSTTPGAENKNLNLLFLYISGISLLLILTALLIAKLYPDVPYQCLKNVATGK